MAGTRITQLGTEATPARRYGSFAGRLPPTGHLTPGQITRLAPYGTSGRLYGSFVRSGGTTGTGAFSRGFVVNNPMSEALKISTARNKAIFMVDSADHNSGKPGLAGSMTIYVSKDGGAATLITPTVTEISAANMPGHYKLALTTAHTDTLGDLAGHITAPGADQCDFIVTVEVERVGLLGSAAIQAVWDAATAALTTAGSVGKRIVDFLTGDAFARLGAPVGASVSADIASVQADTDNVQTRLPAALVGGRMDSSIGALAAGVIAAASFAGDYVTLIATSVWNAVASTYNTALSMGNKLNAAASAGDPWTSAVPGTYGAGTAGNILGNRLDAAVSTRATPAQVDASLATYDAPTHAEMTAELATADDAVLAAVAALNNLSAAGVLAQINTALDTVLPQTIPGTNTRPTLRQGVYMTTQFLLERTVAGTALVIKNPDGSTLMTLTLGDATAPLSVTRTS